MVTVGVNSSLPPPDLLPQEWMTMCKAGERVRNEGRKKK